MLTTEAQETLKKNVEANAMLLAAALEKVGYTAKVSAWASRFDHAAGGEINISSHIRTHWNCRVRLHCSWKTGAIERVTLIARPARAVTLKYSEKALPGLLERVAACFQADIDAEARRNQDHQQATAWAIQAIKDTRGLELPECLVPSWCRDTDDANKRFQHLHRGMARTPIGRYLPQIDTNELVKSCGGEGLNAAQLKHLIKCLNELPSIR